MQTVTFWKDDQFSMHLKMAVFKESNKWPFKKSAPTCNAAWGRYSVGALFGVIKLNAVISVLTFVDLVTMYQGHLVGKCIAGLDCWEQKCPDDTVAMLKFLSYSCWFSYTREQPGHCSRAASSIWKPATEHSWPWTTLRGDSNLLFRMK